MSKTLVKSCLLAATIALGALAQPAFADPPDQYNGQGHGAGNAQANGPGDYPDQANGQGADQSSENRDWVNYWLEYLAGLDRAAWAHEHAGGNGGQNGAGGTGP